MMIAPRLVLLIAVLAVPHGIATGSAETFRPNLESARANAPAIFNAVHNAMREFGSALHHNGMSMFPAEIPEGVQLYHGTNSQQTPPGPEWLAFEVEHAQSFAHPPRLRRPPRQGEEYPPPPLPLRENPLEHVLALRQAGRSPPPEHTNPNRSAHGYLHIYETTRPLRVLYIDGTSAGKTDMGTLDTQDCLLTGKPIRAVFGDWERASDLCKLAGTWDIDGFIRMEPGFEIVYCDFTRGLKLVSALQQPDADDSGHIVQDIDAFEWVRAASQRYHGIDAARVRLDYSSMVSAFFYPVNLSNPDARSPELPRLLQATIPELDTMRWHVGNATVRSFAVMNDIVDWQGITDMVVSRYADRLQSLAETDSMAIFKNMLNNLLNVHIDYSDDEVDIVKARERCTSFYLNRINVQTPEDRLLLEAFKSTTSLICTALFQAHDCIMSREFHGNQRSLACGKRIVQELIAALAWSKWKECGRCQPNEVCMVAMWPFGSVEDHYHPSCVNYTALHGRQGYWHLERSPRPKGHDTTGGFLGQD